MKTYNVGGMKMAAIPIKKMKHLPTHNPNVMGPDRKELLLKAIEKRTFLQPILVYEDADGMFVIVDGEHRVEAMEYLGNDDVPAVIAPDKEAANELRLSLNRLRGELDMSVVASELLALSSTSSLEDLTLTGFTAAEVSALLDLASPDDEDDLLDGTSLSGVDESVKPKTFNLVLKFETESARAQVKEALERAGEATIEEAVREMIRAAGLDNC